MVHPQRSIFTYFQRLVDVRSVCKTKVEGILLVRVLFWNEDSPLYVKAGGENETEAIISCLTSCLDDGNWEGSPGGEGTVCTVRLDKCEIGVPSEAKGVEFDVVVDCVLELRPHSLKLRRSGSAGGGEDEEEAEWGYHELGLCSYEPGDPRVRMHFNDGTTLIAFSSSPSDLSLVRDLALGRSSALRLLDLKHSRNTLFDNNGGKGFDLDAGIASGPAGGSTTEGSSADPFDLGGGEGGEGMEDITESEMDRYNVPAMQHVSGRSARGGPRFEGEVVVSGGLTTCVEYEGGEGGGRRTTSWKEMHFELAMEREEVGEEGGGGKVLLPYLRCYGSSRKRKVLFKVGVANANIWVGGGETIPTPDKWGYGLGVGLPGGGMAVLCSSDPGEIGRWASVMSGCLCEDMRNFLTAHDAGLLSSRLYRLIETDDCVGMLRDMELSIRVNVGEGGGGNKVDVEVWSKGVGGEKESEEVLGEKEPSAAAVVEKGSAPSAAVVSNNSPPSAPSSTMQPGSSDEKSQTTAPSFPPSAPSSVSSSSTLPKPPSQPPSTRNPKKPRDTPTSSRVRPRGRSPNPPNSNSKSEGKTSRRRGTYSPTPPGGVKSKVLDEEDSSRTVPKSSSEEDSGTVEVDDKIQEGTTKDEVKEERGEGGTDTIAEEGKNEPNESYDDDGVGVDNGDDKDEKVGKSTLPSSHKTYTTDGTPSPSDLGEGKPVLPLEAESPVPTVKISGSVDVDVGGVVGGGIGVSSPKPYVHSASGMKGTVEEEEAFKYGIPPPPPLLTTTITSDENKEKEEGGEGRGNEGDEAVRKAEVLEGEYENILREVGDMKKEIGEVGEVKEVMEVKDYQDTLSSVTMNLSPSLGELSGIMDVDTEGIGGGGIKGRYKCVVEVGGEEGSEHDYVAIKCSGVGGDDGGGEGEGDEEVGRLYVAGGEGEGGSGFGCEIVEDKGGRWVLVMERRGGGGWKGYLTVGEEGGEDEAERWAEGVEDREREWRGRRERERRRREMEGWN
ncbi:hypothetical protein TrCOL_g10620 [Triparma columacea]|nr:hypothetical protein TrCOL_g10620 [Triparma columacea]